jgi:hypothetical protein
MAKDYKREPTENNSMERKSPKIFIILLLILGIFFCLLGAIDYVAGWNNLGSIIPVVGIILIIDAYILGAVYKQKLNQ